MKRHPPVPKAALTGRFTPTDFAEVLLKLPEGCPIVDGQAVVWWATRYGISVGHKDEIEPLTSVDIDFWGSRDDLEELARRLDRKAVLPHEYEMTVWVGAIPLSIKGEKTIAEFLHTIPGLDTSDPDKASVEQEYIAAFGKRLLQFLSPVSLVWAKLHALRHFNQKERQDEMHLRVCLQACQEYIADLLRLRAIRETLWNCERLIEAYHRKPYAKLAAQYGFNILTAVPIEKISQVANDGSVEEPDRKRLKSFCDVRWPQVSGLA